jgi:hypothetical protein
LAESLAGDPQEVEAWQQKDAALQKEFLDLVPVSNQFNQQLMKIFKRKIKRNKKVGDPFFRSTSTRN